MALPFSLSGKSALPSKHPQAGSPQGTFQFGGAIVLLLTALATLAPQASAQYGNPQYIQATPNYVAYPQAKPSPYGYPVQPAPQSQTYVQQPQQYAQPQYAPQPQYAVSAPDDHQQYPQQPEQYPQPQQAAQPFAAQQLSQLVAPIALYPDTLVAQILAASTYPAQVIAADNWLHSQGYATEPMRRPTGTPASKHLPPSRRCWT